MERRGGREGEGGEEGLERERERACTTHTRPDRALKERRGEEDKIRGAARGGDRRVRAAAAAALLRYGRGGKGRTKGEGGGRSRAGHRPSPRFAGGSGGGGEGRAGWLRKAKVWGVKG